MSKVTEGKRKRGDADCIAIHGGSTFNVEMHHMPHIILQSVASFLNFNDKISFAMSLPTWKCEVTHDVSKTIVGSDKEPTEGVVFGDHAYYGDHHMVRSCSLTDLDVKHILVSIDAVNKLKVLEMTHCMQVEGHGLEPLRSSSVLEVVDLSLVDLNLFDRYEAKA
jgi:hypothetical protein